MQNNTDGSFSKVIITNNPKVKAFYEKNANIQFETLLLFFNDRKSVFKNVRDHIHQNWKLINHAMAGNIPLHKHPYRSMALKKQDSLDTESLVLWEAASERVNRGRLPEYPDDVLEDFQELDFILFTDNLKL